MSDTQARASGLGCARACIIIALTLIGALAVFGLALWLFAAT